MHETMSWQRPRTGIPKWGETAPHHGWGVVVLYFLTIILIAILAQHYYGSGTTFLIVFLGALVVDSLVVSFLFYYKGGVSGWSASEYQSPRTHLKG